MNDPTLPRMTDQAPELLPCPDCKGTGKILIDPYDLTHENCRWCYGTGKRLATRPTPAERPVPPNTLGIIDAHDFVEVYNFCFDDGRVYVPADHEKAMLEDAINGYIAECEQRQAECPVPQVREALKRAHQNCLALWEALEGGPSPRCRDCADFNGRCQGNGLPCDPQERALERIKLLRARPSDAAVAWRYRHKDTEGWLMLKNGRDPTEWLKQWTNTEYEVEALAPMRPEAADEIERLRNQLAKANGRLNGLEQERDEISTEYAERHAENNELFKRAVEAETKLADAQSQLVKAQEEVRHLRIANTRLRDEAFLQARAIAREPVCLHEDYCLHPNCECGLSDRPQRVPAPHNSGERDPSVMPDSAGAETSLSDEDRP